MTHTTVPITSIALPAWYREMVTFFNAGAGHCFLLTGDVHGVTSIHGKSQLRFMQEMLHTRAYEVVAYYHRATGITFLLPSMRERAVEILGAGWTPPVAHDRYAVALRQAGLPQTTSSG